MTLLFVRGGSITLRSDQSSGITWSNDETSVSIIVDTTGKYFVEYDNGTGCGILYSDTITVKIDSLPKPVITGALGICPNGTTTLDAGMGYSSYEWSNFADTRQIQISTGDNLNVVVTDSKGCQGISQMFRPLIFPLFRLLLLVILHFVRGLYRIKSWKLYFL